MCKFAMGADQKYDLDKLIGGFVAEMLAQEMLTKDEADELIGNQEYHGFAIIWSYGDPNGGEADICLSVSQEDHDAFFIQMFNNDFEYLYPISVLEDQAQMKALVTVLKATRNKVIELRKIEKPLYQPEFNTYRPKGDSVTAAYLKESTIIRGKEYPAGIYLAEDGDGYKEYSAEEFESTWNASASRY